ncbi:P-loop NTPase fold protein [Paenibacillus sp. GYB004]|uniref:KAP family P-loop NTPase fold protein n=1 Tax=Paenibacillus sp. GYB004 TaxID=2994393 RepID=UPI002F963F9A
MWSDNETDIDLLDFNYMVTAVTSIVKSPSLLPATIGVFGDWGSGKSSLIRMIQKDLQEDEDILCLTFNGWLFEGYDDAKTALMGTILDEISEQRALSAKAKELVTKLTKRIDWFRTISYVGKKAAAFAVGGPVAFGLSAGVDIASFLSENLEKIKELDTEKIKDFIKEKTEDDENIRRSVRDFHKDFSELLSQTNIKTLVVFIDDLDRCTPDTIIETLEAIRLFLYAPQTAFILGADERLVRYAVRRRFPELPGERAEVGRDYLEKLIQFPIRVTSLGRTELETYIGLLFANLHLSDEHFEQSRLKALVRDNELLHEITFNYGIAKSILEEVPTELEEGLSLAATIAPILHSGMNGNPRQSKRFLNTLLMRVQMAKSKKIPLKLQVLAKLMVLEYFRSAWFARIAEMQAQQAGKPTELKLLEDFVNQEAHQKEEVAEISGESEEQTEKSKKASAQPKISPQEQLGGEFKIWLSDPWMKEWLQIPPALSDIDLRPYFYFSRDTLGALSIGVKRMRPEAQEALTNLLSQSQAMQKKGLDSASSLTQVDASAVFDALSDRVRQEEDLGDEGSAFMRLLDWADARKELIPQLITLLMRMSEAKIPPVTVMKVIGLAKDTEAVPSAYKLLEQWSQTTSNKPLASLANRRLSELA